MIFWLGILVAAGIAWLAVQFGLRDTWLFAFNVAIAVFLAIFMAPAMISRIPSAADGPYGTAVMLMAIAVGGFILLQGIAYAFITSRYKVPFPRILDTVGAGCLGFAAGFLLWSFLSITVSMTPLAGRDIAEQSGFRAQTEQAAIPYIGLWCDGIAGLVVRGDDTSTKQAVDRLFEIACRPADPNQSVAPGASAAAPVSSIGGVSPESD